MKREREVERKKNAVIEKLKNGYRAFWNETDAKVLTDLCWYYSTDKLSSHIDLPPLLCMGEIGGILDPDSVFLSSSNNRTRFSRMLFSLCN